MRLASESEIVRCTPNREGGLSCAPLLTFVVINWNFGSYIGSTIASIKNQSYDHFQCIVVDNGSNDDSVSAASHAMGDDRRFQLVELGRNVGHLAAFIEILDLVEGDYVCLVDSDDFLLPEYAASHLQVHLSFAAPVGVTTSNLIEVSVKGAIVAGGRTMDRDLQAVKHSSIAPKNRIKGLNHASVTRLARATTRISRRQNGWIWFPGTSNVFRRAPLERAVMLKPKKIPVKHFSDTFFLATCHYLEGTAIIDLPLSIYRRHAQNTENNSDLVKLNKLRIQGPQAAERAIDQRYQLCAALISDGFGEHASCNSFWRHLDLLLRVADEERPIHFAQPVLRRALESRLVDLVRCFGLNAVLEGLLKRMNWSDVITMVLRGYRKKLSQSDDGGDRGFHSS